MNLQNLPINPTDDPLDLKNPAYTGTSKKKNWKLTEQTKILIIKMLAEFMKPEEIQETLLKDHNVVLHKAQIYNYSKAPKWKTLLRKFRDDYLSDLSAVAGSHKRVRLERAEKIFDKAMKTDQLKLGLDVIAEQRKETELTNGLNLTLNQYNFMTDEEIENKKNFLIEKIKKIESRTIENKH